MKNENKIRKKAEKLFWNSTAGEFWYMVDYILGIEKITDEVENEILTMPTEEVKKFIDKFSKKISKKEIKRELML